MNSPRDANGSPCPHAEPGPRVVLVCESCDHMWEPSVAELGGGPVLCTQCGGWTTIAELAEPITSPDTRFRAGEVPSCWLQITGTMSASELLALREKVTERGIDPHDLDAVRAVSGGVYRRLMRDAHPDTAGSGTTPG